MMNIFCRTAGLAALGCVGAQAAEPALILVESGRSEYQIVLPDAAPSPQVESLLRQTGELLQRAFAANGAEIPLVVEAEKTPGRPGIYLGDTAFARSHGIRAADLEGWQYRMQAVGPDVILAGRDEPNPDTNIPEERMHLYGSRMGTTKAVADFLRQFAGVRFLYPNGETGIEYLPTDPIAVPAGLDVEFRPPLQFLFCYASRGARSLPAHLYDIANNYLPNVEFEMTAHTYPTAIPPAKFRHTHPQYFALRGERRVAEQDIPEHQMVHYCISNPDVQELIYAEMLRSLDNGFDLTVIAQQDGFLACQCEECHALYDTGENWSEKLWIFHRKLAERLYAERPDQKVMLLAYGHTWDPPETFDTFPPNAIVWLCRTDPETLEKWRQVNVPAGFTGYLYQWGTYNLLGYSAQRTPTELAEVARRLRDMGMQGLYLDGFGHAMGMEGPNYYLFGRMFDPEQPDPSAILEEFYDAAFREAAAPMRRFYDTLYHAIQFASDMPLAKIDLDGNRRPFFPSHDHKMKLVAFLYAPDVLDELDRNLARAEQMAVSEKVKSRLALVRLEFEYIRRIAIVAHLHNAYRINPEPGAYERLLDAVDAWNEFLAGLYEWDEEAGNWQTGMRRGLVAGWPEMQPFLGHSHHAAALTRFYADTPLNWDTNAMREAAAAADAGRLQVAAANDRPDFDSPEWEQAPEILLEFAEAGENLPATSLRALASDSSLFLRVTTRVTGAAEQRLPVLQDGSLTETEALDFALDPTGNRESWLRFVVGPAPQPRYAAARGFIQDTLHPLFGRDDPSWDQPWSYASRVDPESGQWVALLEIPLASFGVNSIAEGELWAASLVRSALDSNGNVSRIAWPAAAAASPAFAEMAFGAADESLSPSGAKARRVRLQLYQDTFEILPEWQEQGGLLPAPAFGEWKFRADPSNRGVDEDWFATDLDTARWQSIQVPAFWVETDVGDITGFGWYRVNFTLPEDWKGSGVRLLFGGVDEQAWIYVNGSEVGQHTAESQRTGPLELWDVPFAIEVPAEHLVYGGPNLLAVRVFNSMVNGGIWRPVLIQKVGE